jgi:hypothetical protein
VADPELNNKASTVQNEGKLNIKQRKKHLKMTSKCRPPERRSVCGYIGAPRHTGKERKEDI